MRELSRRSWVQQARGLQGAVQRGYRGYSTMFSIDDHAGNVVTTVTVFMVAATILYVARGAFLVLFLSFLFAYLLEPAVTWVQTHSRLGQKNRTWAIAQVYLIGTLVLGTLGYEVVPHLAAQVKNLNTAVPAILDGLSSGKTAGPGGQPRVERRSAKVDTGPVGS